MTSRGLGILLFVFVFLTVPISGVFAGEKRDQVSADIYPVNIIEVKEQYYFEELDNVITVFKTIYFDKYSTSLFTDQFRKEGGLQEGTTVLDLGTGTGALCFAALAYGAEKAVGTDLDPLAIKNSRFNARQLGLSNEIELRQVALNDTSAYSVVGEGERFDLVVVVPPEGEPSETKKQPGLGGRFPKSKRETYFSIDPDFSFLKSIIADLSDHLTSSGRCLIALKTEDAKKVFLAETKAKGLNVKTLYVGERDLDERVKENLSGRGHKQSYLTLWTLYEVIPGARE